MKTLLSAILFITTAAITASATESIKLAWDYDGAVTGFRIYLGTSPKEYSRVVDCPGADTRQAMVNDLTLGVTHYAAITAYNSLGLESEYSPEFTFTPQPDIKLSLETGLRKGDDPDAGPGTWIEFDAPEGYVVNLLYSADLRHWTVLESYVGDGVEVSEWWPRTAASGYFKLQITRPSGL